MIVVDRTGPLALLQDLGRGGSAHLGVSPSGAADRTAHRLANRLVGNAEATATIETVLGGLAVTATSLVWVAVTGAPTQLRITTSNGQMLLTASHTSLALRPGDQLTIESPERGLRNYLGVRGGFALDPVLGSLSYDVLSGLGPAPLQPGQQLDVRRPRRALPNAELAPAHPPRTRLALLPGPRRSWFTDAAWSSLLGKPWTVTGDLDRVAVRLSGPPLERLVEGELPSEGLVRGAVQVPASGQPLIFLADHPVTGGYPVIGVLTERAADHAAQLRPGDRVRFDGRTDG
ncbi:MAG TPA: biotin-dependent carboxyltransferase family protein [Propionibacteriaceae bacterium]